MKVSVNDFESHLVPFMKKVADSMPTSLHKFLGGAMIATSTLKVEDFLKGQADADGMIDTDRIKRLIDSGFSASGGDVVIPFGNPSLTAFGVRPVNVKITKADADQFFAGFAG